MATPSGFLNRKAEERKKKLAAGDTAPDSGNIKSSQSGPLGRNPDGTASRASSFLEKKAAESRARIDAEYGRNAYGGSGRYEADMGAGFNSWLNELNDFSARMGQDWDARNGVYQDNDELEKYLIGAYADLGVLQNRADKYRRYFSDNREVYGDEAVKQAEAALDEGGAFLADLRKNLEGEQKYWAQFENEEEYNSALAQQREYERLSALDEGGLQQSLDKLEEQLQTAEQERANALYGLQEARHMRDTKQERLLGTDYEAKAAAADRLAKQAAALRRDLWQVQRIRKAEQYNAYRNEGDFTQYSAQGAGIENPSFDDVEKGVTIFGHNIGGKKPGNIVTYSRDNWEAIYLGEANGSRMTGSSLYRHMTDEQVDIYNYLLAKEGEAAAREYLDFLQEDLNRIEGTAQGKAVREVDNGIARTGLTALYGTAAGLNQFKSGMEQLFSEERLPTSAVQFGSEYIREDLAETGPKILGSSLGQAAYDVVTTTANMAPSILLSYLTAGLGAPAAAAGAVGSVALGASAGGNAYNAALQDGYTPEEARNYSILVGASEGALQYVLGGIGKLGGKLTGSVAQNAIKNIDSALLRVAAELGINMAGEGVEEYLQDNLEPAFRNLVFDEDNEIRLVSEEAAYSFLLGAVTAGLMEGGHIAANNVNLKRAGASLKEAGRIDALMERALALDPEAEAHKLASDIRSGAMKDTDINVGQLLNAFFEAGGNMDFMSPPKEAAQDTAAEEVAGDILAEAAAQAAERGSVSNSMAERILSDEGAASALGVAVDGSMTKSQQRAAVKSAVAGLAGRESAAAGVAVPADTSAPQNAVQMAQAGAEANAGTQGSMGTGKAGRQVLRDMYDPAVPVTEYYAAMDAYYQAGVRGEDAANVQSGGILTVQQQEAAYLAGLADGANGTGGVAKNAPADYTVDTNTRNGGNASEETGAGHFRGQRRTPGVAADGQGTDVEAGAGSSEAGRPGSDQAQRAAGRRNRAEAAGVVSQSTRAQGVAAGTDSKTMKVLPSRLWDEDIRTVVREKAKEGIQVVPFIGQLEAMDAGGVFKANGWMSRDGKRMLVRADHDTLTMRQLADHEEYHAKAGMDKKLDRRLKKELAQKYGKGWEKFLSNAYAEMYFSGQELTKELEDYILQEILADAYAGIDVLRGVENVPMRATDISAQVRERADKVKARGPPVGGDNIVGRFSREDGNTDTTDVIPATRKEALDLEATDARNVARYRKEIKDALAGEMPSNKLILMGRPSAILRKYLKNNNPLYMPQSAAKKAALAKEYGGKHGLGSVVLDEMLYQFDDPMAITGNTTRHAEFNDNSIVVWTDWMTESGASVIVPIRIGVNGIVGVYNNVNTAFDAYNPDYVSDLLRDGNVLYTRNNKNIQDLIEQRRQVPKFEIEDVSKYSINGGDKKVNGGNTNGAFSREGSFTQEQVDALQVGVDIDTQTESVYPERFSRETWEESEYVQERKKAIEAIAASIGVSKAKAGRYIDAINSVSALIADDRARLDYEAAPGLSPFVSNSEYGGSFDFSTLCKKRRLFTGTFTAVQKALKNTALTAADILKLRNMMKDAGLEVSCGFCYVEGSRANMGQFTQEFIRLYKKYHPGETFDLTMADLNTPDGIEWVRINRPEVYTEYVRFWNNHGRLRDGDKSLFASQQKPKLYQARSQYDGEILKLFGNSGKVSEKNKNGGIRFQSFSDFEIVHLIDNMQVIMDMSRVGLAGQAYTKVPDFAWAMGDTGLKINLSLVANGVDANGRLTFDGVEGMPIEDAIALRNTYGKNVGTIVVVFGDEQLMAAMADPRIDFIIPFHRSQWKKSQYEALGIPKTAKDYTRYQNEKLIRKTYHEYRGRMVPDKATNYMPNEYWDFSLSGKQNAEKYLKMCAENNKRPKFYQLLSNNGDGSYSLKADGSTDGYWKLLIDFKMYDNDGNGSPQMPVRPNFSMDEIMRMLNDYKGGHLSYPVANGIVDQFVAEYKKEHPGEAFSREADLTDPELQARLTKLLEEYGAIKPGENPFRNVNIPQQTEKENRVSQTVRTILEAKATPDEVVPTVEQMVADGEFSYRPYSDKQAVADARAKIEKDGWAASTHEWFDRMKQGSIGKANTTMGWLLYDNAANSGDTALAMDILNRMVESQRDAAQALQATRILKQLSPEAQLYGVQRSVDSLQEEISARYGDNAPDLRISEELAEKFLKARSDHTRAEALKDIYRDIGRQMPSRFMDKFNAWRYIAMLANPRTHVRNIVGNAGFAPVVAVKDTAAAFIEGVVLRRKGGRTKAFGLRTKTGRALIRAAWADYANVKQEMPDGKYSDLKNANRYIEEGRQIFGRTQDARTRAGRAISGTLGRAVEKVRVANSRALTVEDQWFAQPHYAAAMAQYCLANGITAEEIASGKGQRIRDARAYAMKEAQKATYQDTNDFSSWFSNIARTSNPKGTARVVSYLSEGVLPFRKTPANILVRGVEYSPIGLLNGVKKALLDVHSGRATAAEAIDSIAAGLTGTALVGLGIWLASLGLVRGHGDDEKDKEKKFKQLQGVQYYALELPDGTSATLDWLAPEALPFFVGVNLYESTSGMEEAPKMADLLGALTNTTEPLLEMSCLQGLNDIIESVGYASSNGLAGIPQMAVSSATSLLTQLVPTFFGQVERSGEEVRMTTYTDKNKWIDTDMQYFLGKLSAKIPGLDYSQIPYIDEWGRTEYNGGPFERIANNMLNPAYMSEVSTSETEEELQRLYDATGDGGVLPGRAAKYFTVDGERVDLTAEQYVEFAAYRGRRAYQVTADATSNAWYRQLDDKAKASVVKACYDTAQDEAKALVSDYTPDGLTKQIAEAQQHGISAAEYILFYKITGEMKTKKDSSGKVVENKAGQVREWLKDSGLPQSHKEYLWSTQYKEAY